MDEVVRRASTPPSSARSHGSHEPPTIKHKVWLVLEEPRSSTLALVILSFILLCIIGSTITFCLGTVPEFAEAYQDELMYCEWFFVAVFTIEFLVRFWATVPEKMTAGAFMSSPMNAIDLLSILPFYADLLVVYLAKNSGPGVDVDLRILRIFRLFRIFKIVRFSTQLTLIARAMGRSWAALVMMVLCIGFGLIIFSTLIYLVERGVWDPAQFCYARVGERLGGFAGVCSPFQSIPEATWWAIATMTTVGYGDAYPITVWGRVVGGITMVIGILCIALPTTILGIQFEKSFGEVTEETNVKEKKDSFRKDNLLNDVDKEIDKQMKKFKKLKGDLERLGPLMEEQLLKVTEGKSFRKRHLIQNVFPPFREGALKGVACAYEFLDAQLEALPKDYD